MAEARNDAYSTAFIRMNEINTDESNTSSNL